MSASEDYNQLLAFVERIAKARRDDTHQVIVLEARRLLDAETVAEVHLDNECVACGGAGYFDGDDENGPEACVECNGTGNALRPVPAGLTEARQ